MILAPRGTDACDLAVAADRPSAGLGGLLQGLAAAPPKVIQLMAAPRAVEIQLSEAAWHYALIALAVHRGGDEAMARYGDALEESARELEGALAEAAGTLHKLLPGLGPKPAACGKRPAKQRPDSR